MNNEKYNDLGLGEKFTSGKSRLINKDGSFNVRKINISFFERLNFFNYFISISWPQFLGIVVLFYCMVNLFFASFYMLLGVENLAGISSTTDSEKFMEAFFFSAQTITTLGYGRLAPTGNALNIVAAIESLLGLLSFALVTGLLYGRFSKPSAKIKYSSCATISPYQDINGFMFRIINPQKTELLEVEVNLTLTLKRENSELRDYFSLELERAKVVFLPAMWTIVHPINDSSPLLKISESELLKKDAEFIITIRAFNESFSQTVYSRTSYNARELKWGHKFVYALKQDEMGYFLDASKLDDTDKVDLN